MDGDHKLPGIFWVETVDAVNALPYNAKRHDFDIARNYKSKFRAAFRG